MKLNCMMAVVGLFCLTTFGSYAYSPELFFELREQLLMVGYTIIGCLINTLIWGED